LEVICWLCCAGASEAGSLDRGAIMMRDLFRESRDLNARSRFTLARPGQSLTPVAARLVALVVRCAQRLWWATPRPDAGGGRGPGRPGY
jgi:hypothetical protein